MFIDFFFETHCSYGLSLKPKSNSVVENKSISIIPYIAFKISTYITFLTLSCITKISYSEFTSHIMSTNPPSNFMCTKLSSGSDVWRYATGTSKVCSALPSWASINNDANSTSNAMVGDVASYCSIYVRWRLPSAHVLPLILPHHFSLIRLTALSAIYFYWRDMIAASWGPKTPRL